jgi:uncharacterized protein Usg
MWIKKQLVLVNIFYYMPDAPSLIQEFLWQTEDFVPEIPRVHAFLLYWKDNIEATIKSVQISSSYKHTYLNRDYTWLIR